MSGAGIEHDANCLGKASTRPDAGAESGALSGEIASDLTEVVTAWPALPPDVRANILAMARALKRPVLH